MRFFFLGFMYSSHFVVGVADGARQAQLHQNSFLFFAHTYRFQPAGFMVIAQQVQHGMYRQIGNFALQAVAVQFGLFHSAAAAKEAAAALKADYAQTYLAQPVKKF